MTGLLNIKLVALGILSIFLRRTVTLGLLLIAQLLDISQGVGKTYLMSPSEMIRSIRYLFLSAPSHLGDIVVIAISTALSCLMVAVVSDIRRTRREQAYVLSTFAIFAILCGTVDVYSGNTAAFRQDFQLSGFRLTRFPGHALIMSELEYRKSPRMRPSEVKSSVRMASKMMAAFEAIPLSPRANSITANVVLKGGPHPARELILEQTAGCSLVSRGGHLVGLNFIGDSVALGGWVCIDLFENKLDRKSRQAGPRRKPAESQPAASTAIHPR